MQESHSTFPDGVRLCELLPNDFNAVMEYLVNQFIPNEPLAKATAMTAEDAWNMNKEVVEAALSSSLSYAFRNRTDEIVAVRLCSTVERPTSDGISGVFSGIDSTTKPKMIRLPRSAYEITRILSALESQFASTDFWDILSCRINMNRGKILSNSVALIDLASSPDMASASS
uniref:N-acetyltransferase domain-containing protein n=1 Tax=Parascaris univalens TaxID=6257 RepID=A0A914ZSA1_PARUN